MALQEMTVLVHRQAAKYGDKPALKYKDYDTETWIPVGWNEFDRIVRLAANALVALEVEEQENVGIFSQNKPECLYTDFAAFANRAVTIPLYATSSPLQVQYIVNDACIRYLFIGEQFQYDAAFSVFGYCETLKQMIIFDRSVRKDPRDLTSLYWDEFLELGKGLPHQALVDERTARVDEHDLMNILYTSGTTGEPKGVMLRYSNYNEIFRVHDELLSTLTDHDVSLNFLPLTHIFEKAWTYFCLHRGTLVCVNLRPAEVQQSLREVRPTVMCSVPRFWEKVYQGVHERIANESPLRRALMLNALKVGREHNLDYVRLGKTPPLMLRMKYKFYEKTIYALLKKTIGLENGNFFPTAGAAVSDEICEFAHSVGLNMMVGYNENSEILLRGKTITDGYYKKPRATAEAFDADGWFHTGDAGYLHNGHLYLTGRIKELFKTSNGKYISPQALETRLTIDRYIDQIAIIADRRKFVSALIVPVYEYVKEYAARKNISYNSMEELLKHPKILALFQARIDTLQQQFAHYEQVKRFVLLPRPFSMEQGELTNTLKLRRAVVAEHFKDVIDKIYEEAEAEKHVF